jgi:CelD/BcsL family acetyltransferase involved in cellulose biosynthesis
VHALDPLRDPRWAALVERHPKASVFHTTEWLRALRDTYGYEPIAYTTSPPGAELEDGYVFCGVRSWLTGRRLVSLPFSDHCEPLVRSADELNALSRFLRDDGGATRWRYVEMRPAAAAPPAPFAAASTWVWHRLDLRPEPAALMRRFHKDCVQRKIRRAEREGLTYEAGRDPRLLDSLYGLLRMTRERHGVPPQPRRWFENVMACLGDRACIRIASKDGRPVAGILTLRHRQTMVYKYGGSDDRANNLGGTALLFWNAIQEARRDGAVELDLGRSDADQAGLIAFKQRWGAVATTLTYWRHAPAASTRSGSACTLDLAKKLSARLPGGALTIAGRLLYRHIG